MILIVWFILYTFIIEPIINHFRKKKPEDESRSMSKTKEKDTETKLRPMREYQTLDPDFREAAFRERLSNLYVQLQDAWHDRDLESVRPYLTDALYNQGDRQLNEMRRSKITPVTERIAVLEVKLLGFYEEAGMDHIKARLKTRIIAYEVHDTSGKVISGSKKREKFMEYEWDLCRKTGTGTGSKDGAKSVVCPQCGAPLNINQTAKCPYCGSVVTVDNADWALDNIKGISQQTR